MSRTCCNGLSQHEGSLVRLLAYEVTDSRLFRSAARLKSVGFCAQPVVSAICLLQDRMFWPHANSRCSKGSATPRVTGYRSLQLLVHNAACATMQAALRQHYPKFFNYIPGRPEAEALPSLRCIPCIRCCCDLAACRPCEWPIVVR